jgi:hypothetical protein
MRVYADDIDKLRIPMPASSNWGDPKGRVDPEVLRAAAWGTDFDADARRNAIAAALTPPPAAPQQFGGVGAPAPGVGLAGGGSLFGAVTPQTNVPGTANYIPGTPAAQPTQQDYYQNMMQLDWGPNGPPPEYAPFPWAPRSLLGGDYSGGGASGSAAGTGGPGGDTG